MTGGDAELDDNTELAPGARIHDDKPGINSAERSTNTSNQAMDIDVTDWGDDDDEGLVPGVLENGEEDHYAFLERINADAEAMVGGRELGQDTAGETGTTESVLGSPETTSVHGAAVGEPRVMDDGDKAEVSYRRQMTNGGGRTIGTESTKAAMDLERARIEIVKQKEEVMSLRVALKVAEHDARRSAKELKNLREAHDDVLREEAVAKTDLLWERSRIRGLEDRWSRERCALEDKVDALEKEMSASIPLPGTSDRGEHEGVDKVEQSSLTMNTDQDEPMDTGGHETVSARVHAKGNGSHGAIRGHGRVREMGGIMTSEMFSPTQVKMRPATNGKPTVLPLDLRMKRPPQPTWNLERGGLFRGYPADPHAWKTTHDLQLHNKFFVHRFRHFLMFCYARAIPLGRRTPVQQLAAESYVCPDWFADALSDIAFQKLTNDQMRTKWPHVKVEEIGYHPSKVAQLFQVREWTKIRGCPFVDDCWTLYMPWVRGWNLVHQAGMEDVGEAPMQTEQMMKIKLDKLLFQIIGTPGLYASRLQQLQLVVASTINLQRWPVAQLNDFGLDDVVRRLAQAGIVVKLVDDAFYFAQKFARDPGELPDGWTSTDMDRILAYPDGTTYRPKLLFAQESDYCCRSPFLPSKYEFENGPQFELSHWRAPELEGMQRPYGSRIADNIKRGIARAVAPRETNVLTKFNPYLHILQSKSPTKPGRGPTGTSSRRGVVVGTPISEVTASSTRLFNSTSTHVHGAQIPGGLEASVHAPTDVHMTYISPGGPPCPSMNMGLDPQLTIQPTFLETAAGPTTLTNLDGLNLNDRTTYGTTFNPLNTERMLAEISTVFGDPTMGNEPTYNFLND
ncbi:hypothetical protein K438DRAFT_1940062 [Mycena galopus ATCC 62051]|nr:hypothetical protein K438DRAFT_1940062 [Mycena galopus ATCC 62051]